MLATIDQPFTIWMLRRFFANIPADLDEGARVDGCSRFQAFRRVIMPVIWPGVITAGLFMGNTRAEVGALVEGRRDCAANGPCSMKPRSGDRSCTEPGRRSSRLRRPFAKSGRGRR
ncbi:MAG: ABC transporter permease subunit [Paracoccaceae bacterium]